MENMLVIYYSSIFLPDRSKCSIFAMMKRRFLILYFLIAFASIASNTYSTTKSFVFEPFSLNDKLSSNSVTRTFQDRDGYVWFGTKDGLCRFDGYDIKVFRSSALTPGKLTNNEIECLAEDNSGKLWIGTMEGINKTGFNRIC